MSLKSPSKAIIEPVSESGLISPSSNWPPATWAVHRDDLSNPRAAAHGVHSICARVIPLRPHVRADVGRQRITIGSTVLQNRLARTLPAQFTAQFPSGAQIAYSALPVINILEEPLRTAVRTAFAESLKTAWLVMIGMSGAGLVSVALMREVRMQQATDDTYGLEDKSQSGTQDSEKADAET